MPRRAVRSCRSVRDGAGGGDGDGSGAAVLAPAEAMLLTDRLHWRRRHSLLIGRFTAKRALAVLTRLWCLKEALSKALRCGLGVPFPLLEISAVAPSGPPAWATFMHFGQYHGLSLASGRLAAALVVPGRGRVAAANAAAWSDWLATMADILATDRRGGGMK